MSDVPSDIYREILLRLPAVSVFRFRTVCKVWRRIIEDPFFVKSHMKHQQCSNHSSTLLLRNWNEGGNRLYSFSLESLSYTADLGPQTIYATLVKELICPDLNRFYWEPLATCNGLILISYYDSYNTWVIWNPLFPGFHRLPQPNRGDLLSDGFGYWHDWLEGCGLGYDYATDDYKTVRIDRLHRDRIILHRTFVYSLKLGSWRMSKDCPYDISFNAKGVFLNGALHWTSGDGIVVLDLATEHYSQLQWPPIPNRQKINFDHLGASNGCLLFSCYQDDMKSFQGWAMRDYGVERSWMKLFSIGESVSGLRLVAYLKSKRQVLLKQYEMGLFLFDIYNNSLKNVTIDGFDGFDSFQCCAGSLLRFDDSRSVVAKRTAGLKREELQK